MEGLKSSLRFVEILCCMHVEVISFGIVFQPSAKRQKDSQQALSRSRQQQVTIMPAQQEPIVHRPMLHANSYTVD